ncbi:MAG: UDP-N-acetylmuramate dehydrogenase [Desulfococcaceae bacterium]
MNMRIGTEERKHLREMLGENIRFDEPMSRHTSFRAGGPAAAYASPDSKEKLLNLIRWAAEQEFPHSIVGDGTNLLVKDSGYPGIIIVLTKCLRETEIIREENDGRVIIRAGAGVRMKSLCRFAMQNRLEGISPLLGIPGTVGGGIWMNAGTSRGEIADILHTVTVLSPDGNIRQIDRQNLCFTYRKLIWSREHVSSEGKKPVIAEGDFVLHKSMKTVAELDSEAQMILAQRHRSQPLEFPSAGCFFKNPASGRSAGELIDRAELKGARVGGAEVSAKHANFIINRNRASASDILSLADMVKNRVAELFGIELEREVKVIGQSVYP